MASTPLIPVILCGGTGTRLWPLSRASYPKQYWLLSGDGEATLLQQTQQRLQGLDALAAPLLICNEDHRFIVAEQMRQIGVEPNAILLEPMGRNTAPAVTVAALQATANGEDPLLLVLAADHLIRDATQFRQAIDAGRKPAEEGRLVTFGIVPTAPETGYGYIEASEPFFWVCLPCADQALCGEARSGQSRTIPSHRPLHLEQRHVPIPRQRHSGRTGAAGPGSGELLPGSTGAGHSRPGIPSTGEEAFAKCPNVAIDVAVMEKTELGSVLPLDAGWSDVGSWSALWETSEQKDSQGNVLQGHVIAEGSRDCYLRSEHRLVVGLGLKTRRGGNRRRRIDCGSLQGPGDQDRGEAAGGRRQPGGQGAPEDLSPLGPLHRRYRRNPLAGETDLGETRRKPVAADAPPPGRALGGSKGHCPGGARRQREVGGGKPEHLHPDGLQTPPLQPRPDPSGTDRSAERRVPRRGRHHALPGPLRPQR